MLKPSELREELAGTATPASFFVLSSKLLTTASVCTKHASPKATLSMLSLNAGRETYFANLAREEVQ
jgi:hypothetical protein